MAPNERDITETTELFVVNNDLIIHVIYAENKNLNVVDEAGFPVIAASYRQSKFGMDNINWDFVKARKQDFLCEMPEEEEDKETWSSIFFMLKKC
jgi:hypothetical protein